MDKASLVWYLLFVNPAQIKLSLVFLIFAIIGFGPISLGCLTGIYIVLFRPAWFKELVLDLYKDKPVQPRPYHQNLLRLKWLFSLATLFILDLVPYPVTPSIAFPIIFLRPKCFFEMCRASIKAFDHRIGLMF